MKFSYEKKQKMRKFRERRINRNSGSWTVGSSWTDWQTNEHFDIADIARFGGHIYLLVEDWDGNYAIFKKVHECNSESVKLSSKKILQNKKAFEHPSTWQEKSKLTISDTGLLTKVEEGKYKYTSRKHKNSAALVISVVELY